jgi:hypothetical protein
MRALKNLVTAPDAPPPRLPRFALEQEAFDVGRFTRWANAADDAAATDALQLADADADAIADADADADADAVAISAPRGSDAKAMAAWVQTCLEGLPSVDAAAAAAACEEEDLDQQVLCSLSEDELSRLLVGDSAASAQCFPDPRAVAMRLLWLSLRRLRAQQEHGHATQPPSAAETAAWLAAASGGALAPSAETLRGMGVDGALLCSLSKAEWQALAPHLVEEDAPRAAVDEVWARLAPACAAAAASAARCLETLPQWPERPFTVCVAGDTGAGKSTLLNTLLGTDQLLPTNAMR